MQERVLKAGQDMAGIIKYAPGFPVKLDREYCHTHIKISIVRHRVNMSARLLSLADGLAGKCKEAMGTERTDEGCRDSRQSKPPGHITTRLQGKSDT